MGALGEQPSACSPKDSDLPEGTAAEKNQALQGTEE